MQGFLHWVPQVPLILLAPRLRMVVVLLEHFNGLNKAVLACITAVRLHTSSMHMLMQVMSPLQHVHLVLVLNFAAGHLNGFNRAVFTVLLPSQGQDGAQNLPDLVSSFSLPACVPAQGTLAGCTNQFQQMAVRICVLVTHHYCQYPAACQLHLAQSSGLKE